MLNRLDLEVLNVLRKLVFRGALSETDAEAARQLYAAMNVLMRPASIASVPGRGGGGAGVGLGVDSVPVPGGFLMPVESIFPRLEPLLPLVQKPIQYVGGELNSCVKDWDGAEVRWAL